MLWWGWVLSPSPSPAWLYGPALRGESQLASFWTPALAYLSASVYSFFMTSSLVKIRNIFPPFLLYLPARLVRVSSLLLQAEQWPRDVHALTSDTCDRAASRGKRDFAGGIKAEDPGRGRFSWIMRVGPSDHVSFKVENPPQLCQRGTERGDYGRVGEETGLVLKMEGEGAMAPGMQTASRSRKGKEMDSPLGPLDKNTPGSTLLSAQGDPCGLQQPTELEDDGTCVPSPHVYGNLWQQQKATHTHTSGKDTEPVLRQGPSSLSHGPRLCRCPFPSLPLTPVQCPPITLLS